MLAVESLHWRDNPKMAWQCVWLWVPLSAFYKCGPSQGRVPPGLVSGTRPDGGSICTNSGGGSISTPPTAILWRVTLYII